MNTFGRVPAASLAANVAGSHWYCTPLTEMPGLAASNCATLLSNSLKAAWVLPGINETTLMWTTEAFLADALAAPTLTASRLTAATIAPIRMDDLALVLNFMDPLLSFPGNGGAVLRPNRVRVERSPVCGLDQPDRGVLRQHVAYKLGAPDKNVCPGGKFHRLGAKI